MKTKKILFVIPFFFYMFAANSNVFDFCDKEEIRLMREATFTWAEIKQMCSNKGYSPTEPPIQPQLSNFNGTWTCPGRGKLILKQVGNTITGGSFNSNRKGQDWDYPNNGAIADGGRITGLKAEFRFIGNNDIYTNATANMDASGSKFNGSWKATKSNGAHSGSGSWHCHR